MSEEFSLTDAITEVATALHRLGIRDAATPMGAVEILSLEVRNGSAAIAEALNNVADAIREMKAD